jgi:LAS superfamily LD-carboxypeptidase LdcB
MKKFLFVAVCLFVVSVSIYAQQRNRRSPEESAKRMTDWMTSELKLTQEQIVPVDSINLVFAKAQAKLIEAANGDFNSVRESMQKLNEEREKAYAKFLTKEQLEAFKKLYQERMRNRGGNRNRGN